MDHSRCCSVDIWLWSRRWRSGLDFWRGGRPKATSDASSDASTSACSSPAGSSPDGWRWMCFGAALVVYLLSPFLLIWLFNARPLDESPLRQRLEAICKRCGLKYRNIMLWQTDFSMANAAVIGLLPGWRYVLLSDRLMETMTDTEIEAVFAHELGHIVHNHMSWFVVFFAILVFASLGPGQLLERWLDPRLPNFLNNYPV